VVGRRYTRVLNEGLERPGLIVVDGGRGQVSAAASVLASLGLSEIPLIGLAKENEEIWPAQAAVPLVLPRSSPALKLLQAVRDETHRFANRLRTRQKARAMARLTLEEVKGIGPTRSRLLLETYGSIEAIAAADPEEIARRARVSLETARALVAALDARPA
jgi:excinuclease ABC subunit C